MLWTGEGGSRGYMGVRLYLLLVVGYWNISCVRIDMEDCVNPTFGLKRGSTMAWSQNGLRDSREKGSIRDNEMECKPVLGATLSEDKRV